MTFSKLDFMMKNRFLGMKMGSRTRPDHPRPRKTRKTGRKPRKTRKIENMRSAAPGRSSMPENRKMTKKIKFEKNLVEKKFKKPKILEKKNSRHRHTIGLTFFF